MSKINRQMDPNAMGSGLDASTLGFNPQAGAFKSLPIGPHLLPIPVGTSWTTTPTAATSLPRLGANIAVYNNAATEGTVTIGGTNTITAQAIGAFDASGNAGIPCPPNAWTYLSMGNNQWIISSAATLFVFMVDDSTFITITH